jgi:heavy metal sensor kinase
MSQFGFPTSNPTVLEPSQIDEVLKGKTIVVDTIVNGSPVRMAALKANREGHLFAVVVGTKTELSRKIVVSIAILFLVVDVVTVFAVVTAAYLIVGRALRPVNHITHRASQIGAGDLRQRLEYIDSTPELTRLTEVLNETFDKLDRLFESQKQFVQDASHEIRSPLAALICRLEVALRQERGADEYRRIIESSFEDAARLKSVAENLITLARVDLGGASMEFREVSIPDVLVSVHEQLSPLAESRQINFILEATSNGLIYADRSRIEQAFRNIAENSLKYTPRGGQVLMRTINDGEYVRTEIEDTGIGIPEEEQENVFRRFYRLDDARSRDDGGTGLGLSICDQIVRAHSGHIVIDSAPEKGTRFTISFASAAALTDVPFYEKGLAACDFVDS